MRKKKKKNTKCAPEGNQILPIHKVNDAEKCTGFTKMFSKGLKKKNITTSCYIENVSLFIERDIFSYYRSSKISRLWERKTSKYLLILHI